MARSGQTPTQDLFGEAPAATAPVTVREKRDELRRELEMRRALYPKWVEAGRMSEETSARRIALLEAIAADYEIRPWPQTTELVRQWRRAADRLTVLGVRADRMHRDELLAVLAYAVDALRKAGALPSTVGEERKP